MKSFIRIFFACFGYMKCTRCFRWVRPVECNFKVVVVGNVYMAKIILNFRGKMLFLGKLNPI